jgi:hypothetical protein
MTIAISLIATLLCSERITTSPQNASRTPLRPGVTVIGLSIPGGFTKLELVSTSATHMSINQSHSP